MTKQDCASIEWKTEILRCPECSGSLRGIDGTAGVTSFECAAGHHYPVLRGVPRFVESESYTDSFGVEWNRFPHLQLDSANGTRISCHRFRQLSGLEPEALAGKRVLEVGCGPGRFLDVLAPSGAEIWGVDLSLAVEPALRNMQGARNCRIIQADLFRLPFAADFDFIYSFGVLHHTPDPAAAFRQLVQHLRPGGSIAVWVYGRGVASGVRARWIPRPWSVYGHVIQRLPLGWRERVLRVYTQLALALGMLPLLGPLFQLLLPIQDLRRNRPNRDGYEPDGGDAAKREAIRFEWALHSAFDGLTPKYTHQYTNEEVRTWAEEAGLIDIRTGPVVGAVTARKAT